MPTKLFCHLSFVFFLFACTNPFANQSLSMTTDPGVTEAWISLHVDGVKSGADYIVQRDGKTVFKGRLQSPDTVVYDSLLKPATTYTYRFFARENGDDSPALQSTLTTLDTTSHNFSWQSYEFGGQNGSSYFQDVAIIDENDIWAVGEIYTKDDKFNAAHWDGQKWTLIHISPEFRGHKITPEIEGVFAFDTNNIWFCAGGAPVYWNGEKFTMYHLWDMGILGQTDGGVTKAWGTSSANIYFVGRTGTIVHYDGKGWMKIDGGTDLPIQDIWGCFNFRANTYDIYAIASDEFNSILLRMNGNSVLKYPVPENALELSGIWFQNNRSFFIVGDGIFTKKRLSDKKWFFYKQGLVTSYASAAVRGEGINDIFISGGFFELVHFNGLNWHKYDVPFSDDFGVYGNIDIRNNRIILVGYHHQKAIIVMGKR